MAAAAVVFAPRDWDHAPVRVEKLCALTLDLNLYPREKVDKDIVENYARALEAGAQFPTVKVGLLNGEKIIVDGAHRIGSRKQLQIDYVDCAELPFSSAAELFAEAVRLNADHGKAFSDGEVKANIVRLQKFRFQVKDIQVLLHVPAREIHKESAAPVTSIRTPWGEKKQVSLVPKPATAQPASALGGRDPTELIVFKNALKTVIESADSCKVPVGDRSFEDLVVRARSALGRLVFS